MPSYAPIVRPVAEIPVSLTARLRKFFADNPDEMLTYGDIAIKFDCTREQAQHSVGYLRSRDLLSTMHVVCVATRSDKPLLCDEGASS